MQQSWLSPRPEPRCTRSRPSREFDNVETRPILRPRSPSQVQINVELPGPEPILDVSFNMDLDSSIVCRKSPEDEGWQSSLPLSTFEADKLDVKWGDKVFFYAITGDRLSGKVRWIGTFASKDKWSIHAGLELDVPLGYGNGSFHSTQLFWTKPDYACFVPLDFLTERQPSLSAKIPSKLKGRISVGRSSLTSALLTFASTSKFFLDDDYVGVAPTPFRLQCVVCYAEDVSRIFLL
ncbi:hypothetical protein RvY_15355 [Ramazzottius varieornatus]|uniref:CAP-Gly domain-containing protein n=1 Tax=Ramazzottius varieornatus TaxID=947166 RepID=A0A1D1VUL6_RAMVA|nr:hypothetical protein RvY_15355 [Ramazzottius varieornatus]